MASRDLVVDVYDGASPATHLATLQDDSARTWHHQFDDVGSVALDVQVDNPDAPYLMGGNIVVYSLNGTPRFAGVLRRPSRDSVALGASRLLHVRGLGALALMDRGVLLPELGINRASPDHRLFGFMSSDFDHTGWGSAEEIKLQSDQSFPSPLIAGQWTTDDGHSAPGGWPDPTAYWIWGTAQGVGSPPQAVGDCLFWREFTLTGQADLRGFISADDGFELYLDGALVAAQTEAFMWGRTQEFDLFVDAGTHYLAIRGVNITRDIVASNVAGVIFTLMNTSDGGAGVSSVVVNTDASWSCLPYPSPMPGMNAGEILTAAVSEVQALGADYLPGITLGFDTVNDSNGNPWAQSIDIGWPVGTSILAMIRTLVEQHVIDVEMTAGLVLNAYNYGTLGTDLSATVALVAGSGGNLEAGSHDGTEGDLNSALVKYHTGQWRLIEAPFSMGAIGARMALISLGTAPSSDAADRTLYAVFDDLAGGFDKLAGAQVIRQGAGSDPYDDWAPGDTVSAPGIDDAMVDSLVQALTVTEDAAGKAVFVAELTQETGVAGS